MSRRAFLMVVLCLIAATAGNFFQNDFQTISFKMLTCKVNPRIVYQNYSCFSKSYSRSYSGFTVSGVTKFPLNNILVKVSISFKYGMIYREVIRSPVIDVCPLMQTTSSLRLISQLIKFMKDSAPEMIHECPYYGLNIQNRTLKTGTMNVIYPTGDYKIFITAHLGDEPISNLTSYLSVNSSYRHTFG